MSTANAAGQPRAQVSRAFEGFDQLARDARALEQAGEWNRAEDHYLHLAQHAIAMGEPAIYVDALRGQARIYQQQERYEEAEEILELSREIAERHGLFQAAARAVNSLAALRYFQRDWDAARALYESALVAAFDIGDDALVAWTCQNLGVVANITGDLQEARLRYLESIAASVRAGDESSTALVYNNLGKVCCYLEEWLEALLYFDRGIEIAERLDLTAVLAKLHSNRAESLIGHDELDRARNALHDAEAFAATLADSETLADIARFRGIVAARIGDVAAAEEHFARSLALVGEADLPLEHAQLLQEIARFRWEQSRRDDALITLREARQIFVNLDAHWNVARVEALLTRWEEVHASDIVTATPP